jgi:hypothetical protein
MACPPATQPAWERWTFPRPSPTRAIERCLLGWNCKVQSAKYRIGAIERCLWAGIPEYKMQNTGLAQGIGYSRTGQATTNGAIERCLLGWKPERRTQNAGFERVGRCLSVEFGLSPSHPASLGEVDCRPATPDQSDRAVSVGSETTLHIAHYRIRAGPGQDVPHCAWVSVRARSKLVSLLFAILKRWGR